ncbi:hypothetical protein DAPPUDRAFT_115164 [Daphnia pulex]|uniref:RNase III domain-containing protein n=1 Tax=Daphnia pulex TaxID=6669 RepID=E9HKG5_DAPPU|nr:hypothetical protein DAPPUDRAFT_115164 [Daphnia pulex]|eukprot:EFX67784.1 hypothetical protein DAPPUDRAFT_115164 [Daphnia pulex]
MQEVRGQRLKGITENLNATAKSLLLVPGVLADLFESVGGAIYKNSGFSRKAVLKSYTLFLVHAYATPENGNATTESLLVPGVLADLFEAVADAIYKDSGYSRKAVVKSFTPFLYQAYVIIAMMWMGHISHNANPDGSVDIYGKGTRPGVGMSIRVDKRPGYSVDMGYGVIMDHVKLGPRLGQDVMLPSPGVKNFVVGQEKTGKDTIHCVDLDGMGTPATRDTGYLGGRHWIPRPTLATHKADTGYPDTGYPTLATQRW